MTLDESERLQEILAVLGESMKELRPREREFVQDVISRFDEHGASMYMSAAQWRWIEDIASRFE